MTKYKVIGDLEIAGASKGETVDLDPDEVNVDALVASGHVEEIKSSGGTRTPAKAESVSGKRSGAAKGDDE